MKKLVVLIAACAASTAAQAELLVKKGSKATLQVKYEFVSKGSKSDHDRQEKWDVHWEVNISATYVADQPQQFGQMHAGDADQKAAINEKEGKVKKQFGKMAPMMNDMKALAEACNYEEKCIDEKVRAYGDTMQKPDVAKDKAALEDIANGSGARYQLWRSTGQSGTYDIREDSSVQVDGTIEVYTECKGVKLCKTTTNTIGSGAIPNPPGRSVAGASSFEVDGIKKDLMLQLPGALQPLPTKTTITSTVAGTNFKSGFAKPVVVTSKPLKKGLNGDKVLANGQEVTKIPGEGMEGGTLTVSWTLTAQ